jgi:hypothetical protein
MKLMRPKQLTVLTVSGLDEADESDASNDPNSIGAVDGLGALAVLIGSVCDGGIRCAGWPGPKALVWLKY